MALSLAPYTVCIFKILYVYIIIISLNRSSPLLRSKILLISLPLSLLNCSNASSLGGGVDGRGSLMLVDSSDPVAFSPCPSSLMGASVLALLSLLLNSPFVFFVAATGEA